MRALYIGIDPGANGGLVALKNGKIAATLVMPITGWGYDIRVLVKWLKQAGIS